MIIVQSFVLVVLITTYLEKPGNVWELSEKSSHGRPFAVNFMFGATPVSNSVVVACF